jgi:hypothetical protein
VNAAAEAGVAGALVQAALVQAALVVPELALVAQAPEPAVEALEPAGPVLALAAGARVPAEARALAPQAQVQVALQARPEVATGPSRGPLHDGERAPLGFVVSNLKILGNRRVSCDGIGNA